MKKFGLLAMAALAMVACQNKNAYTISGTYDAAAEGDSVSLQLVEGRKMIDLQKVAIVGGKFEFKGIADSVQVAALTIGDAFCQLFLEPGAIKVDMKADQMVYAIGTPNNNAFEAYSNDMKALQEEYAAIAQSARNADLSEAELAEIRKQMGEFEEKYYEALKNSVIDNVGTDFGLYNLNNSYYYFTPEELAPVLEGYLAAFPTNVRLQRMKANNDLSLEIAVGKQFKDFEMADVEGNMHKISEYVAANEVTLIDFWASWCGPCRQEMPEVKKIYEQYKDKGFDIGGVSLDNNKKAWTGAIKKMELPWHHISDLKGWDCEGAAIYGINSIPATILFGPDGKVVASGLRAHQLAEKLAEVIK